MSLSCVYSIWNVATRVSPFIFVWVSLNGPYINISIFLHGRSLRKSIKLHSSINKRIRLYRVGFQPIYVVPCYIIYIAYMLKYSKFPCENLNFKSLYISLGWHCCPVCTAEFYAVVFRGMWECSLLPFRIRLNANRENHLYPIMVLICLSTLRFRGQVNKVSFKARCNEQEIGSSGELSNVHTLQLAKIKKKN